MEPTRVTSCTATCIDNIFFNGEIIDKCIISSLRSDHCGQMISVPGSKHSTTKVIKYRPVTAKKVTKFKQNVLSTLPILDLSKGGPDEIYSAFFDLVSSEFNSVFKIVEKRLSKNLKFCDWATVGIYKSRNTLFDLYAEKRHNFTPSFVEYVRSYSKLFRRVCSQAKSLHIKSKIINSDNKIKTAWNIITHEIGKHKVHDNKLELNVNNRIIDSDDEIASTFENFFQDIPITTTVSLNSSPTEAHDLLKGNVPECDVRFKFKHVTPYDIIKVFKSLQCKTTVDLWGLSVKIINNIIDVIAPYLALIFNKSVDSGSFPDLLKCSKVIPLFKSGCKGDPNNYRPISILPTLSKIFEKIMLNQLLVHFNLNNLLHPEQYGFTKGRSTIDAAATLLKHIFDAWIKSQNAIGVFCDLSKAFDCVEHRTLLGKLSHYGVKDTALSLIASYLSDRVQKVCVNNVQSSGSTSVMGVPQGSILGPFMFLVYINDLPFFVQNACDIVLFADDTSLIFKVDRTKNNFDEVNGVLSQVSHWFTVNNLLLNAKKTKCVEFTLPNTKSISKDLRLNNEPLKLDDSTVFLGITLDSKLQWSTHISTLAGKLSSAAYAVRKIRHLTDVETAKVVYFAYFHSIMSYGLLLWGTAADIQKIFVLQKRAIRAIYNLKPRDSLREKFKEIGILTIPSQYIYINIIYVRQNIHKYQTLGDLYNRQSRNRHKLATPVLRLKRIQRSFVGMGVSFYNKVPLSILNLPLHKFKESVKNMLLQKAYYNIGDYINDKRAWI